MRRLLLMRHAKSSWGDASLADHERPLSARGRRAARAMGKEMLKRGLRPDLLLVSDAARTRETAFLMLDSSGIQAPVRYLPELYLATQLRMLDILKSQGGEARSPLMLAHDPGIWQIANALITGGTEKPRELLASKFPTGALAVIDFADGPWADLQLATGQLEDFIRPRDLDD